MISELAQLIQLFAVVIPAAIYTVLIPALIVGEILHQLYPELYPYNVPLQYIDHKT